MKTVGYTIEAAKNLRKHQNMAARLRSAIERYAANPEAHANAVRKLVGSDAKRLRVGDFRMIFRETETDILVMKAAPRGDVYD